MYRLFKSLWNQYRLSRIPDLEVYKRPFHRPFDPLENRIDIWRRIIFDKRLRHIYDRTVATIDREQFRSLQEKFKIPVAAGAHAGTVKYLDLAPWIRLHSKIALQLNLDTRAPSRVLDIGSGGGHFLAIAKVHGHHVTALDLPDCEIYSDLLKLFGISRIAGGVYLGQALPSQIGKYDIITINAQNFDVHRGTGTRWNVQNWMRFLEYLTAHHLTFPGEIFVGLNKSAGPTGTEDYLWPLLDAAKEWGAQDIAGSPQFQLSLQEPLVFD
ncbi:class I SAM-dependent methyltransferase [Parasphingopyxis sp. CP4]|uniref:hypothetical protein n=1 Tax=Parasphingopyxis sp. CP4 TaxID=2724527 RepID=UPI0015A2F8F8|nr:hypothetical protein [Parasphingopyxis sp. CP4]QLC20827.1 class I SAM-dependent methyltransferase [Parasphingopyxis sp. CP4]